MHVTYSYPDIMEVTGLDTYIVEYIDFTFYRLRRDSDLLKPYFHMGSRFSSSPQLSIPDLSTVGPAISMIDETISTIKKGKELYSLANIKLVAAKPSHVYLPRNDEIKELWGKYKALRNANPPNTVVALYIKGTPACGKTQLAREFAESFFDAYKGSVTPSKHVVVATLDLKSESRFWRSYHRLAVNINCPTQGLASANKLRDMLSVTANEVQRQLRGYTNWLLVVEGLTSHSELLFYTKRLNIQIPLLCSSFKLKRVRLLRNTLFSLSAP